MKINIESITESLKQGDIYTLNNPTKEEFYTIRIWARSKGYIISKFAPEISISMRKKRDLKGSISAWLFKELDRKEAQSDFANIDVWDAKITYLRTIVSRYNKISSVKWSVRAIRAGRSIVYRDVIEISTENEKIL